MRLCGIEAGGRLVQEEHRGPVEDGAGHHQSLRHATGKRHDRGLGAVGQPELVQRPSVAARASLALMPKKRPWK